jgi:hypothetical protein
MTQFGESVAKSAEGPKKCIYCGKDHKKQDPAPKHNFERDMNKLKSEGRAHTIATGARVMKYPSSRLPPLVEWQRDILATGGYKAAAHHCIALKSASEHKISGELKEAGYNPNRGSNCCWLPYSAAQFTRARAYKEEYGKDSALQKHRGGHTNAYFDKVIEHLDEVQKRIAEEFCFKEPVTKEDLLDYMEMEEDDIWDGLTDPSMDAYHLYNTSYLDPTAAWGSFPAEEGRIPSDVIGTLSPIEDDEKAEKESENDPE